MVSQQTDKLLKVLKNIRETHIRRCGDITIQDYTKLYKWNNLDINRVFDEDIGCTFFYENSIRKNNFYTIHTVNNSVVTVEIRRLNEIALTIIKNKSLESIVNPNDILEYRESKFKIIYLFFPMYEKINKYSLNRIEVYKDAEILEQYLMKLINERIGILKHYNLNIKSVL